MDIQNSFWFSKIRTDLLILIKYEIYGLRAPIFRKKISKELKKQWKKRKVWERLLDSYGKNIHEGRVFLYKNMRHLLHIYPLGYKQLVYLCGIKLKMKMPTVYHDRRLRDSGYGTIMVFSNENDSKIIGIGQRNGWEDFHEQTNDTIIRYLMEKEDTGIKCY